jgi:hypothetical protein
MRSESEWETLVDEPSQNQVQIALTVTLFSLLSELRMSGALKGDGFWSSLARLADEVELTSPQTAALLKAFSFAAGRPPDEPTNP